MSDNQIKDFIEKYNNRPYLNAIPEVKKSKQENLVYYNNKHKEKFDKLKAKYRDNTYVWFNAYEYFEYKAIRDVVQDKDKIFV